MVRRRLGGRAERLSRELRRREAQQAAVADLGQAALVGRDVNALLQQAVDVAGRVLGAVMVNLERCEPDGWLHFVACHGAGPGVGYRAPLAGGPVSRALQEGRRLVVGNTEDLPEASRLTFRRYGVQSSAAALVGDPAAPWGALTAHGPQVDCFSADDLNFLQSVANVVAAVLARAEVEDEVRHRAAHDTLTGLPGGERFRELLRSACEHAQDAPVGLLLLDLDGFKDVNDFLGHAVGDAVLQNVARRLEGLLRDGDAVGRLGGDEFAVCLPSVRGRSDVAAVASVVRDALADPVDTSFGPVSLGASVGGSVYPDDATDLAQLLKHADLAMYRAKRERAGWLLYDPAVDEDPTSRLRQVNDLRAAITGGALTLAYQPVVDLKTSRVTSVEALVRWTHPEQGPQSPAEFVALAERSGLIGALTHTVLGAALRQVVTWRDAGTPLPVAVNMPGSVLARHDFPAYLDGMLAEAGVAPELLRLEVTETTLVSDAAISALRHVVRRGMRVAVDDFGTGFSSLGRLKELPVQTLKIDRSFVTGLATDPRDLAIVRAVVALAHDLRLNVVAEGTETADVVRTLRGIGVARAQGFLYSRPLPAPELDAWRRAWESGGWADPAMAPADEALLTAAGRTSGPA